MKSIVNILLLILTLVSVTFAQEYKMPKIDVFFKEQKPSQKVIAEVNKLLDKYKSSYQINYILITDSANARIIEKFGLPSTHFPCAVVINGKFTAKIGEKTVSFVHFPDFMKGIGRHEGNWSVADLEAVLKDNALLTNKNILPVLEEEKSDSKCGE